MSNRIKFKDLRIGVFVLFNNEYAVKSNKRQIMTSQSKLIEPDENDMLEIQTDCDRDIYVAEP